MKLIEDAAYDIILNNTLKKEILRKYNEFPALYDKHKKKFQVKKKRLYTMHYGDYEKVAGVLFEATKNPSLQNEINDILIKYYNNVTSDYLWKYGSKLCTGQFNDDNEFFEYYDRITKELVSYYDSRIFYENFFIFMYMNQKCTLPERRKIFSQEDVAANMTVSMLRYVFSRLKTESFKSICDNFDKEVKVNTSKDNLSDLWNDIYEIARAHFGVNKNNGCIEAWGNFINYISSASTLENFYVEILEKEQKSFIETTGPMLERPTLNEKLTGTTKPFINTERGFSFGLSFTYEIILMLIRNLRLGIDAPMILITESLSDKEIKSIIYLVRHSLSFKGTPLPIYTCEWGNVIENVVNMCFHELLIKNYIKALNSSGEKETKKNDKAVEKTMLKLKEENERLHKIDMEHKNEIEKLVRKHKEEQKNLLAELHELKSRLADYEEPQVETTSEDVVEEAPDNPAEPDCTEEEFRELINSKKILVWGMRIKHHERFKEKYPTLDFIETKNLTKEQVAKYDGVIIDVTNTPHSTYYAVRDRLKNAGISTAVMKNSSGNDYWLWKAGKELLND